MSRPASTNRKQRIYQVTYRLRRIGLELDRNAKLVRVPAGAQYIPQVWAWIAELRSYGWSVQQTIPEAAPRVGRVVYVYEGSTKDRSAFGMMRCRKLTQRRTKKPGSELVQFETGEVATVERRLLKRLDELPRDVVERLPDPSERFGIRMLELTRS